MGAYLFERQIERGQGLHVGDRAKKRLKFTG